MSEQKDASDDVARPLTVTLALGLMVMGMLTILADVARFLPSPDESSFLFVLFFLVLGMVLPLTLIIFAGRRQRWAYYTLLLWCGLTVLNAPISLWMYGTLHKLLLGTAGILFATSLVLLLRPEAREWFKS